MPYQFQITDDQLDKIHVWLTRLPECPPTAIGGRLTYRFTPTSIGLGVSVLDEFTKEELDLTDYESW